MPDSCKMFLFPGIAISHRPQSMYVAASSVNQLSRYDLDWMMIYDLYTPRR